MSTLTFRMASMFFRRSSIAFVLCTLSLVSSRVFAQFGGAEEHTEQARGPKCPPGKRGSPGLGGTKGDTGTKGEIGPRGIEPEIDLPCLKTSVLKALSVETCEELWENADGEKVTGYYLLDDRNIFVFCNYSPRNDSPRNDPPRNCSAVQRSQAKVSNATGGVFDIFPESEESSVEVYCDLETDGGGWTVFQRRMDGSVDFFLGWNDYVNGFGRKDGEFWLGLENIHQLTKDGNYELRVDLMDFSQNKAYAKYQTFSIASRDDNYRLSESGYSGTAGDSLSHNNGAEFSTKDADNDQSDRHDCALTFRKGAWWYKECTNSNLNGLYNQSSGSSITGISWEYWKGFQHLKFTEMKFRKKE